MNICRPLLKYLYNKRLIRSIPILLLIYSSNSLYSSVHKKCISYGYLEMKGGLKMSGFNGIDFDSIQTTDSNEETIFIENRGQWGVNVLAKASLNIGDLWLTKKGLAWHFWDTKMIDSLHDRSTHSQRVNTHTVFMDFVGAIPISTIEMVGQASSEYYNFFHSSDPKKWQSKLHKYNTIRVRDVWPGIDLELKAWQGTIKYNWIVKKSARIDQIQVSYQGLDSLRIGQNRISCYTSLIHWDEYMPLVYQNIVLSATNSHQDSIPNKTQCLIQKVQYASISTVAKLTNTLTSAEPVITSTESNMIGLKLQSELNKDADLIIDPLLVFSTYTGSRADNFGCTGTYDIQGNGFTGGTVFDIGLPTTAGAAQEVFGDGVDEDLGYGGSRDAAILKFNAVGSKLLYCTYLGGSNNEQPHSMVTDTLGNLFIMGSTRSSNFPTSIGCYSSQNKGNYDFFITKLNANGTQILASTYIGGSGLDAVGADRSITPIDEFPLIYNYADEFRGEIVTDQKSIYVAGVTYSDNFPNTGSNVYGGKSDGIVFCLDNGLKSLQWSELIGSGGYDALYGVALGKFGDVFVSGGSTSSNLNSKWGVKWINPYLGGIADAILLRLDNSSGLLLAGRYHGNSLYDQAHFVQTDNSGRPYIYGQTEGNMANVNARFYQAGGGQFISCFSSDLKSVDMQTSFGVNTNGIIMPNISPSAFLIDRCERIFVSGWGGQTNNSLYDINTSTLKVHRNKGNTRGLQVTNDAAQKTTDGSDFYIGVFSKNFYSLAYATFFGGISTSSKSATEHVDGGTSRFDAKGVIYQAVCAGCRRNGLFPVTPMAYSKTMNSNNCNNALFKIDFENLNLKPRLKDTFVEVIATQSIGFQIGGVDPDPFDTLYFKTRWLSKGGMKSNDTAIVTLLPGIGKGSVKIDWKTLCSSYSQDTAELLVYVMDKGCPKADTTFARIKILVTEPPKIIPPDALCVSFDRQTSRMLIAWKNIPVNKAFFKYFLLRRTNPDGSTLILDTIYTADAQTFTDKNIVFPRQNNYCYELIGVNICNVQVFSKNIFCTVKELNSPIVGVPIYTTTIVNDKYAEIRWARSKELDFKEYELYRTPRGGKFGSTPLAILVDTFYRDSSFDVDGISFCYQIVVVDACGHVSNGSNEGCNVVIGGTSSMGPPNYYFDLNWMDYQGWAEGVKDWKLERKDDEHAFSVLQPSMAVRDFKDDQLNYDYGGYFYRVTATRNAAMDLSQSLSESNWIYLIQPPEVWIPTGITRNNDGLNDVWGTFPLFVKKYTLSVFNRYGQKIWQSTNKKTQWDCQFEEEEIPDGVYAWAVEFIGWDNKKYTKTGTVSVLH